MSRTFSSRRAAVAWEVEQKNALFGGADLEGGRRLFSAWAQTWQLVRPHRAAATHTRQDGILAKYVLPRWGATPVSEIRRSAVRAWAKELGKDASSSTVRLSVGVLRQVLEVAFEDRAIPVNPAVKLGLPADRPGEIRPLTHEQLWELAWAMPDQRYRLMVLVSGYCGTRVGELAGLNVGDFDVSSRTLAVSKAFARIGKGDQRALSDTKTHETRLLPVPATVTTMLVEWIETLDEELRAPHQPLFHFYEYPQHRLSQDRFRTLLRDACDQLDLPHTTPHNLRDTCASLAVAAGASVVEVARLLGHRSAAVTLDHYISVFPSGLEGVASRLDLEAARAKVDQEARRKTENRTADGD
ncbi:tyrosine-type recombinase/integrase [Corynebacterium cystitidis]|uniref:tyrosine-type recombinase/integrase n=1 Tax=Corynebacterium cystitidis TaxID=35757 RepID=UPI00115FE3A4|nr:site-specific integrase [Corynebacterium cystitidis]